MRIINIGVDVDFKIQKCLSYPPKWRELSPAAYLRRHIFKFCGCSIYLLPHASYSRLAADRKCSTCFASRAKWVYRASVV
jgi:hypothetical protein